MTLAAPRRDRPRRFWLFRPIGWLVAGLGFLLRVLLVLWATLAIHYSNLPWPVLRQVLAIAFLAFAVWALWLTRRARMVRALVVLFFGVLAWWITIQPSHDRPWRPEVAVMPRATIDGDLFNAGWVDATLPFEELRRRSRINDAALAAGDAPDFSERIRAALPTIHPDR